MLVNGPIAVARLENRQGGVIYLFGDVHLNLDRQTECSGNEQSLFIDQALRYTFKKYPGKDFSLWVEMSQKPESPSKMRYTSKYIHRMQHLATDISLRNVNVGRIDFRGDDPTVVELLRALYLPTDKLYFFDSAVTKLRDASEKLYHSLRERPWAKVILRGSPKIRDEFEVIAKWFGKVVAGSSKLHRTLQKLDPTEADPAIVIQQVNKWRRMFVRMEDTVEYLLAYLVDLFLLSQLDPRKVNYVYTGVGHVTHLLLYLVHHGGFKLTHSSTDRMLRSAKSYDLNDLIKNSEVYNARLLSVYSMLHHSQCMSLANFPKDLL